MTVPKESPIVTPPECPTAVADTCDGCEDPAFGTCEGTPGAMGSTEIYSRCGGPTDEGGTDGALVTGHLL